MSALELMIWSMAVGTIGAVVMVGLTDFVTVRSVGAAQGTLYHLSALTFVVLLSGIPKAIVPDINLQVLHVAQVLIGPFCSALGNFWIRGWLAAHQRDRFMSVSLQVSAMATPILGLLCLTLPAGQQLPAASILCLANTVLVLWLGVRGFLLGDRLALGIAMGCLLMLPAIIGLYAIAMGMPGIGPGLQALFALSAAACVAVIGTMLWQRNRHERRTRQEDASPSQFDPVTKLYSGIALVKRLIKAQRRRRRTRRDGAVIAVMVFDTDTVMGQAGVGGLNEMFIHLATRIQRQVGVVNPVGRYYDRCFITLVETIHSPAWLRTLGLRVATSLRRPIEVTSAVGQRIEIRADVGVGVVHLSRQHAAVEDILHDAQRMAEAARHMRSRAAMLDPQTSEVVPVERAQLGPRRHGHPAQVPHAIKTVVRPSRA
ncbi:MAG: diguanylate cyclase [Ramlibacter sp.]|nr:diguanylate cyclase [Ramlibacter sp.]